MKRFKAAIASEAGSYSEVGMTYDDEQQYYPQYNYDTTKTHGDINAQYYPTTYAQEQTPGKIAFSTVKP